MPRKFDLSHRDLATASWRSARPEGDEPNRVEVARIPGGMAMRDSDRPVGPVLLFTDAEWDDFIAGLADGEFDLTI
ncbi:MULTISPECIES: DUF397 domain-containing protein [Parafrankia]|uniref:DUF397 domain-containing protein n=1 Tax=Parafrankia colletiae TaxID=573497 RepID=A0A1S1QBK3_9ACTN|nr:DUF397 domain-containing protein [Parafrankia colletiae]MCK9903713.1 DUF397 domain-containing protein [Frankia sp. Cpl3]OHV30595.1 DUF397 domain-containing protein [Parafrankia colletiae]